MDALFHALIIFSANDAAMAIAKHISGSVEEFVNLMNEEAQSLGATGTHFVNPHGLHDENHYTTVYDVYLMLNEALNYETFVDTMQQGSYTLSLTHADGTAAQIALYSTDQYTHPSEERPFRRHHSGRKDRNDRSGGLLSGAALSEFLWRAVYIDCDERSFEECAVRRYEPAVVPDQRIRQMR